MYFGSVKFFKHLIITAVVLAVIIPVTVCIVQSIQLKDKDIEIEDLISKKNAAQALLDIKNGKTDLNTYSAEEFLDLLNSFGINDRELLELLIKYDADAFNEVWNAYSGSVSVFNSENNSLTSPENKSEDKLDDKTSDENMPDSPVTKKEVTTSDTTQSDSQQSTTGSVEEQGIEPDDIEASYSGYENLFPDLYVDTPYSGEFNDDSNYIYLTFDDGPSPNTRGVLQYLDKYDLKATFFVIPNESDECIKYLNTMVERGHSIGIHTMSHKYEEVYTSVETYLEDFYAAFNMVKEQTGYSPFLFRFPGGSKNNYNAAIYEDLINEMTRRGFVYFDWNVDSEDALGANWTQMYNKVLSETAEVDRAVILFHDGYGREKTVLVLEDVITALLNDPRCYEFAAITEKTRPMQF